MFSLFFGGFFVSDREAAGWLGVRILGLIPWVQTSTLPLSSCGTLGEFFNISGPQFSSPEKEVGMCLCMDPS